MIGKRARTDLVCASWRTCDCANAFERSLPAAVRPMAAHGWLEYSAARADATASRVSCVQSTSSHVSVPSTEWQRLIASTADRSRLTDFEVLLLKDSTKFGPPTPLACSQLKAGCIWLRSLICSPAGLLVGPCIKSSMLSWLSVLCAWP